MKFAFMCKDRGSKRGSIAIVGAGPAGLAAAGYLSCQGYDVDVYDKLPYAGGLMMFAIPSHRISPDNVIEGVEDLRDRLSVKFIFRTKVFAKNQGRHDEGDEFIEKTIALEDIVEGYDAILITTGTWSSRRLDVEGEDSTNIVTALEYLYIWRIYEEGLSSQEPPRGRRIVVIGAGLSAVDVAEKALVNGAEVYLIYRRSVKEAPAGEYLIRSLVDRGVNFIEFAQPKRIISIGGFAKGVEFMRVKLGEPDKSGRPKPIPIEGSEFTIETDLIITAIGETPTPPFIEFTGIGIDRDGRIAVDRFYQTGIGKVFAAGDVVSGPTTIGKAFGSGLGAAKSLDIYLTTRRFR